MPTLTETLSVSELEEMFSNVIPCGGNLVPENAPCPFDAPATLVSSHRCSDHCSKQFKCNACYEVWVAWVMKKTQGKGNVTCAPCSWHGNALGLYRPL